MTFLLSDRAVLTSEQTQAKIHREQQGQRIPVRRYRNKQDRGSTLVGQKRCTKTGSEAEERCIKHGQNVSDEQEQGEDRDE